MRSIAHLARQTLRSSLGAEGVTVVDCLLRKDESIPHQHHGNQIDRETSQAGSKAGNEDPRSSLKLQICKENNLGAAGLCAAKTHAAVSICPTAKWGTCAEDKNRVTFKRFDDTQLCPP